MEEGGAGTTVEDGGGSQPKRRCPPRRVAKIFGCCLCCTCCCYLILIIVVGVLGLQFLATLPFDPNHQVFKDGVKVTPPNYASYEWWIGCQGVGNASCGAACCNCKQRDAFRSYIATAPFLEVKFPSRAGDDGQEVVELTGWWMPADPRFDNSTAVVLQHGLLGSINDFRPALAAYLLRSAGFSVLLPNLRAHGSAKAPSHGRMSWGYDYPFDILGAWDYVVNDPDRVLGGPRDASKVGMMGFSMGGFVATTAFGMEGSVPALWVDGPVSDPKDIIAGQIEAAVPVIGHVLMAFTKEPGWVATELFAGISLRHKTPSSTLPTGPQTKRPTYLAQSKDDNDVPAFMAEDYQKLFLEHPDKYDFSLVNDWGGTCNAGGSRTETHNILQWLHPDEYRRRLCRFWSDALLQQQCDESQFVPATYT